MGSYAAARTAMIEGRGEHGHSDANDPRYLVLAPEHIADAVI